MDRENITRLFYLTNDFHITRFYMMLFIYLLKLFVNILKKYPYGVYNSFYIYFSTKIA